MLITHAPMRSPIAALALLLAGSFFPARAQDALAWPLPAPDTLAAPDAFAELESLLDVEASAASKYAQALHDAPASVTIVTADDIEQFGYRTLADVLAAQRGFYVSYDRNYAYAGVRGFGRPTDYNNRLLVLVNGTAINQSVSSAALIEGGLSLDLRAVERIEIVRGPGSALYGTSAMLAVINLVTKDVEGVRVGGTAGSLGLRGADVQAGADLGDQLSVFVAGRLAETDGADLYYAEYGARAEDLDWERDADLLATVGYGPALLTLRAARREKGIPTGAWEVVFNHPNSYTEDEVLSAALEVEHALSPAVGLYGRVHATGVSYDGAYPYEYEEGAYDTSEEERARWVGAEGRVRWDALAALRVVAGGEVQRHLEAQYIYRDELETYVDVDAPFTVTSGYAQAEYEVVPGVVATLGGRYDRYSTVGTAFSPRAALLVRPAPATTLKLLYGEAFRAPSAYEVSYEDPVYGFQRSRGLAPERIRTFEAVWEQQLGPRLSTTLSAYRFAVTDLIDTVELSEDYATYENVGRANVQGLEAEVQAALPGSVRGSASYTYQDAHEVEEDAPLSNSPRHLAKAAIVIPVGLPRGPRLFAALQGRYESARRTVCGTETDGFALADLTLSAPALLDRFDVRVGVRNLFDADYAYPGGFEHLQPAIAQDGRTFFVEAGLRL